MARDFVQSSASLFSGKLVCTHNLTHILPLFLLPLWELNNFSQLPYIFCQDFVGFLLIKVHNLWILSWSMLKLLLLCQLIVKIIEDCKCIVTYNLCRYFNVFLVIKLQSLGWYWETHTVQIHCSSSDWGWSFKLRLISTLTKTKKKKMQTLKPSKHCMCSLYLNNFSRGVGLYFIEGLAYPSQTYMWNGSQLTYM